MSQALRYFDGSSDREPIESYDDAVQVYRSLPFMRRPMRSIAIRVLLPAAAREIFVTFRHFSGIKNYGIAIRSWEAG